MQRMSIVSLWLAALVMGGVPAHSDDSRPRPLAGLATGPDADWERLPDGSLGAVTEFRGAGGVAIPAYLRKPKGPGRFPVIVLLHGGPYGKDVTLSLGRSSPPANEFARAGWAVFAIDYRPETSPPPQTVLEDTTGAVNMIRKLPLIDSGRVGLMGGSRGGGVVSRLISQIDCQGAVLCAPAGLDLIEIKKAAARGEEVVGVLKKMVANLEQQRGATAEEIEKDPARYGYTSALTEAAQARCPVFVISGRNDPSSPRSVVDVYVSRLRAAGKRVDRYLPDNGPHGFYFAHPDIPETHEAARRARAFFEQCFQAPGGGSASILRGSAMPSKLPDTPSASGIDPGRCGSGKGRYRR
jgi:dienelactone hydrolase